MKFVATAIALLVAFVACSGTVEAPPPTRDVDATVQTAVAQALPTLTPTAMPDIDATIEAGMAATMAAIPPTPVPQETSTSVPTPIPVPTPLPTSTPTPRPTAITSPTPTSNGGLRPRSEWTEENPATLQELEAEIEKYRGSSFGFMSFGGAYQSAQWQAYLAPFQRKFGIQIIGDTGESHRMIPAMVATNNYTSHVMDIGGRELHRQIALGNLEELDMSVVDNRNHIETVRTRYGGGGAWSTVLAYNTDVFPEGTIKDWRAFFDRGNFPGTRSVGETYSYGGSWLPALLAIDPSRLDDPEWRTRLGAPTDEDVQAALAYWKANPPDNFWYTGSDCPQFLIAGENVMCTAWSGRIFEPQREGEPLGICWECGHLVGTRLFAMAEGLKEANPQAFEIGQLFIAWTGHPEINAQIALYDQWANPYGPVNLKSAEYLDTPEFDEARAAIPTSSTNIPYAIFEDVKLSSEKSGEWEKLWNRYVDGVGG